MAVAKRKVSKFVLVQPKNGRPFTRLQEVNEHAPSVTDIRSVRRANARPIADVTPVNHDRALSLVTVQDELESVAYGNDVKSISNRVVLKDQFPELVQYLNVGGRGALSLSDDATEHRDKLRNLKWTVEIGMEEGIIDHEAYSSLVNLARDYDEYRPFRPTSDDLKLELEYGRPNGREIVLAAEKAGATINLHDKIGFIDMEETGLEVKDLYSAALHCRAFG